MPAEVSHALPQQKAAWPGGVRDDLGYRTQRVSLGDFRDLYLDRSGGTTPGARTLEAVVVSS
jgi:hypothetical protein